MGGSTVQKSISIEALRGKRVSTIYCEVNPGRSRQIAEEDYGNNTASVQLEVEPEEEVEAEQAADSCVGLTASIEIERSTFSLEDDRPPGRGHHPERRRRGSDPQALRRRQDGGAVSRSSLGG